MLCCARIVSFPAVLVAGWALTAGAFAAELSRETSDVVPEDAPPQIVDLFTGMQAGLIEVQVIPRNEKHVNLLVENKTAQPLTVSVPAALAAAPVQAQFDPFPWPAGDQDRGRQPPQNVGMAPQQQRFPGFGPMNVPGAGPWNIPGGGLFSVPPENVTKIRLTGVCLNHGQPAPRPRIPYELRPIDTIANRPEVAAVCILLGQGEINQITAQLATWHLQSEMSWDELAAQRDKAAIGDVPRYTQRQIRSARRALAEAERLVERMQLPQSVPSPVSRR